MPVPSLGIPLPHSNNNPEKTTSGKRHFISHPSISHCSRYASSLNMRAMSEYFLKLPGDSQPRSYSEYEVREFLGQGVIDSETLTWKPGMDGWQPVGQVLPEKEELDILTEWLSEKAKRKVELLKPQKGLKYKLLKMVAENAAKNLAERLRKGQISLKSEEQAAEDSLFAVEADDSRD